MSESVEKREFDYIVVGSGAGGGPLAANLAERGHEVLLVEAGRWPAQNPLNYSIPAFHGLATEDRLDSWACYVDHFTDSQRQMLDRRFLPNRGVLYPRAGALGGCTAHYAMIIVAAHDGDWNGIARAMGDPSWSAPAMRRYFERVIRRSPFAIDLHKQLLKAFGRRKPWLVWLSRQVPRRTSAGWLPLSMPDLTLALKDDKVVEVVTAALRECADAELGVATPLLRRRTGLMNWALDPNHPKRGVGPGGEGLFIVPTATDGQYRQGTRELLATTQSRNPHRLSIWTDALVTRVDLSGKPPKAQGVWLVRGDVARCYRGWRDAGSAPDSLRDVGIHVRARREVILAAGAFNTPQLLMLSGIGPGAHLQQHGIAVHCDLPGVGLNLQDRYEVGVISELKTSFKLLEGVTFNCDPGDVGYTQWCQGEGGVYTTNGGLVAFAMRSQIARRNGLDPDLFVFAAPGYFDGYYDDWSREAVGLSNVRRPPYEPGKSYLTWVILKAHTSARGYVRLRSSNPFDLPEVNTNSFAPGVEDRDAVVEAIRFVRRINRHLDWATEVTPGARMESNDALRDFVTANAWGHHASCTCKIGTATDPCAVLDTNFRVHGVEGLRVVDASVFPEIPGFFVVAPTYTISEKAADVIHADAVDGGLDMALGERYYKNDVRLEEHWTREIIGLIREFIERRFRQGRRPAMRDAHATDNGCVRATFRVDAKLDAGLQCGVFQLGREYQTWIRFSNGNSERWPARWPDARGMAIKLMGVDGRRLIDDENRTQDFILISYPAFFVDDLEEYWAVFKQFFRVDPAPRWLLPRWVRGFLTLVGQWASLLLLLGRRRHFSNAVRANFQFLANPMFHQYWSMTPYRLGVPPGPCIAVKYSAKPRISRSARLRAWGALLKPGFSLKKQMAAYLAPKDGKELVFDFYVQRFEDPERTPVEDTTVEWRSPLEHVGVIVVPTQDVLEVGRDEFCENLSFNPWHGLAAHKPLGAVNRVRNRVYVEISNLRHGLNRTARREPTKPDIE